MIIDFNFKLTIPGLAEEGYANNKPDMSKYMERYKVADKGVHNTSEEAVEFLKSQGVTYAVINASDDTTTRNRVVPNEKIAKIRDAHPDVFKFAWAGADPHQKMAAVRKFEYAVKELGLQGLYLSPWYNKMLPNDRRYYPLYAKAAELDVPVSLHCISSMDPTSTMQYGHPEYLDDVAVDFPELKLVARHPGFPWDKELAAVAYRQPNVYIELSAINPRLLTDLVPRINDIIQDKVMFGSSYPFLTPKHAIGWVEKIGLSEEIRHKVLYQNAAKFIGLE